MPYLPPPRDIPDGAQIAAIRPAYRVVVILVELALTEQEKIFVRSRGLIFNALRLAVRFVPDNIRPKMARTGFFLSIARQVRPPDV